MVCPAGPPPALVELLDRYDPERAERVRRLAAAPAPTAVLVLGPATQAVELLAATLAARLPAPVRCAAARSPARDERWADVRAAIWVFEVGAPMTPAWWARLADLAGEVDEVHLAVAGPARSGASSELFSAGSRSLGAGSELDAGSRSPGAGSARFAVSPARFAACSEPLGPGSDELAQALSRLAAAPVHHLDTPGEPVELLATGSPATACPVALLAAVARPEARVGYRNALRMLDTGLARAASRLRTRLRRAERRGALTDRELGRRRAELAGQTRAAGDWSRRLRADLGQLKLTATAELSSAARELRDAARQYLARAGRADRARFPALFQAAAERLSERMLGRFDELFGAFNDAGVRPARTGTVPALAAPDPPDRARLEERLMPVLGASGGLGVGRLALAIAGTSAPVGVPWSAAALPVAVAMGVAVGWWLAQARRGIAERARLGRWAAEVLVELRGGWEAVLMERLLHTERRLVPVLNREVAERTAQLAGAVREHDLLTRTLAARRTRQAEADTSALTELTAARDELAALFGRLERASSAAPPEPGRAEPVIRPAPTVPRDPHGPVPPDARGTGASGARGAAPPDARGAVAPEVRGAVPPDARGAVPAKPRRVANLAAVPSSGGVDVWEPIR